MGKKKIIQIITRLNNGGPAKIVIWVSNGLSSEFEMRLTAGLTELNEDSIEWFAEEKKVKVKYLKYLKRSLNPVFDFISFIFIYKYLKIEQPDIVHTHMSKAGLIGRTAAIFYNFMNKGNIKVIHTFHGHVFHSYFSKIKTSVFIFIEKFLAKRTDVLIAISEEQRNEIREKYGIGIKSNFIIIPVGIDYIPEARKNKDSAVLDIGMMGRIADIKNYSFAVDIARKLKDDNVDAKIVIAGGGSKIDLETLRNKINKLDINDRIEFIGIVKNPSEFWINKDLALITSKNEGTPISLIEAMFSRIPFIASKVGGIVDMVGEEVSTKDNVCIYDNAVLIDGFNADDFAEGIKYFMDSVIRKEAGQKSLMIAENKYTMVAHQLRLKQLYNEL